MNEQQKNNIREEIINKLQNEWGVDNRVSDSFDNWVADLCLSKIDELLKEHRVEHCDNEDCPECQTKLLDKYKAELIEKVEKYKTYYNPIGDNINKGRTLACDDILLLIKSK